MQRDRQDAITFVCRAPSGTSLMVDLRPASGETAPEDYARRLLSEHQTSAFVEVWAGEKLVTIVGR